MNNLNISGDLSGLCIITHRGSASPLSVGEVATHRPFEAFLGENPRMWKTVMVSIEKFHGIVCRQKMNNQFHQSVVTLVKNVTSDTFMTKLTPDVVLFITGKKSVKGPKGFILPKLTLEEMVICTLAEFALDKFHTLNGIELKCSFYQGGEIVWKSKH